MCIARAEYNPECTPGYGGCSCQCHYWSGVKHCVPCCYPEQKNFLADFPEDAKPILRLCNPQLVDEDWLPEDED